MSATPDKFLLEARTFDGRYGLSWMPDGPDRPFISPDGRFIACGYQTGPNTPFEIAVISIAGKEPLKFSEVPLTVNVDDLAWTPDGSAIVYADTRIS